MILMSTCVKVFIYPMEVGRQVDNRRGIDSSFSTSHLSPSGLRKE